MEDNPLTTQKKSTGNKFSTAGEALPPEYQILEQKFKVFDYTKRNLTINPNKTRRGGNAQALLTRKSAIYGPGDEETDSFGKDAMEEKGDEAMQQAFDPRDDSMDALRDDTADVTASS